MKKNLKFAIVLSLLSVFTLSKVYSQSCDSVCKSTNPNKVYYLSGMDKSTITGYVWEVSGNGIILKSGQGTDSLTLDFTNASVGTSNICVSAFNDCDTVRNCFKFEVYDCFKPLINSDVAVGFKGLLIAGNLSLNDVIQTGTTYGSIVASGTNPSSVLPVVNSDGSYTFTPSIPGVYVFTISVCPLGQSSGCPTQTLTITVLDPSIKTNPPVVTDDRVFTNPNTPVNIFVLNNDGSGNNTTLLVVSSLTVTNQPKNGSVTVNSNGTITYTPRTGFVGSDTFFYNICDNGIPPNCAVAMVIVDVVGNSKVSYVIDDVASGLGALNGNVLENDKYPDGAKPVVTETTISFAGKGTFTIDKNGKYIWTPVAGFSGSVQIPISICDGLLPERCYTSIVTCITLRIEEDPIPNYISPNGDGSNDVWCIDGILSIYPKTKVLVYNRWGNIVWRSTGPYGRCGSGSNVWFGQKEGSNDPIPDGVYYYLMELEDEFKTTKTGFIEVMRQ